MNNAPRFAIPKLSLPHVSQCELYGALNPEQCKRFLDMGDLLAFHNGTIGEGRVEEGVRDSKIAWIDMNPQLPAIEVRDELIGAMAWNAGRINRDKFDVAIDYFHPLQFTKYALNQHYDWHIDSDEGSEGPEHRRLSFILMLTGPDDYEGGELEFNLGGNAEEGRTKLIKPAAGTIVAFYSHVPHRVRPVTSGERASIVMWAMGPRAM